MALFNYAKREINAKIVYYGPGLCGKTTNIQYVHTKLNPDSRGKLLSLATQTDRTLFFDFLPVELGEIRGFKTRFHLYTVPGQVFYNATRKMVLKGVDGVVFVADSQEGMTDANLESLQNLRDNLAEYGLSLGTIPYVIQCNKRDLPGVASLEQMDRDLNPDKVPIFGASALQGKGVLPTLTTICKMVLRKMRASQGLDDDSARTSRQQAATYKATRQGKKIPSAAAAASPAPAPGPKPESAPPPRPATPKAYAEPGPPAGESPPPAAKQPPWSIDGVGSPRAISDRELALPVRLKSAGESRRVMLRIQVGTDQGEPNARISLEDK